MHKFYTLEDLTQEELNKLSLERNILDSNWNELKKWLEEEKGQYGKDNRCWYESVLDEMQELEQEKDVFI